MQRNHFLATTGGAAAAVLAGLPARAADEVVFAGIFSSTGAYAAFGRDTDRGFSLAVNAIIYLKTHGGPIDLPNVTGMGGVVLINQLRQTQGTGQAGRPAAHNHHVGRHLWAFDALERFAEDQH